MDDLYGVRIKQDNEAMLQILITEISTLREEISQLKKDFSKLSYDSPGEFAEEEPAIFPPDLVTEGTKPETIAEEPAKEIAVSEESVYGNSDTGISPLLLDNIKSVLLYVDKLLEGLPEAKITEFANSDYFRTYRNVFKELGLA
jgi:hypothetical protein